MTRAINWSSRGRKDLDDLDHGVNQRIRAAVERLADGIGDVRRLTGIEPPLFRLRVGDWRVLFRYDGAGMIVILRVLPRDKAYR
ncbi:MAG TPA: type II toxin-antitoxin system RelE/ParE family toxin [Thermoanaerobaculia bacterium]|jgi:mRNA interferase RelE/StbE|nr:type II toxin-antitoxin system RelE/ParE family toxin [Thermoanaerobaculia bacterium]